MRELTLSGVADRVGWVGLRRAPTWGSNFFLVPQVLFSYNRIVVTLTLFLGVFATCFGSLYRMFPECPQPVWVVRERCLTSGVSATGFQGAVVIHVVAAPGLWGNVSYSQGQQGFRFPG